MPGMYLPKKASGNPGSQAKREAVWAAAGKAIERSNLLQLTCSTMCLRRQILDFMCALLYSNYFPSYSFLFGMGKFTWCWHTMAQVFFFFFLVHCFTARQCLTCLSFQKRPKLGHLINARTIEILGKALVFSYTCNSYGRHNDEFSFI